MRKIRKYLGLICFLSSLLFLLGMHIGSYSDDITRFRDRASWSIWNITQEGSNEKTRVSARKPQCASNFISRKGCSISPAIDCSHRDKVKHFIYTKNAKTGSSTIFSILARFSVSYNLNVLMGDKRYGVIDWRYRQPWGGWKIVPHPFARAHVALHHNSFNETAYRSDLFHPDSKIIFSVREPVAHFISAVNFYGRVLHEAKGSVPEEVVFSDTLLNEEIRHKRAIKNFYRIPQLQYIGFNISEVNNVTRIQEYVNQVIKKVDVFILTEQLTASLILLRRRFCWSHYDILYGRKRNKVPHTDHLSAAGVERLLSAEANLGDLILYQAVNDTWWSQPEVQTEEFWEEVKYFRKLNAMLPEMCEAGNTTIPPSRWHEVYHITSEQCAKIQQAHPSWIKEMWERK